MTKAELVSKLAESGNITQKQAEKILTALADAVKESLQKGGKAVLPGLGSLSCVERRARTGRNPRTGAEIRIPAKRTARFSVSTSLSDALDRTKTKVD